MSIITPKRKILRMSNHDCFFFSSRRRHTRCSRDWSSDVCSSDLVAREHLHLADPGPTERVELLERQLVAHLAERRSEEHTSELQSRLHLVCRLLLEKKKMACRSSSPSSTMTAPPTLDRF